MNTRPKLVATQVLSLHAEWIEPIVSDWFELVQYDADSTYESHDCLLTTDFNTVAQAWLHSGKKIVIDDLWEIPRDYPGCYALQNPAWFWYNESLWYRHLGYNDYQSRPQWTHHALMPMRLKRPHRNYVLELLGSKVENFIWSYQSQGRNLPNDCDPQHWNNQRHFNPEWYDCTAFSVVCETAVQPSPTIPEPLVTEKTFKPVAFYHPFVVIGMPGTLKYLHTLGFETFENLFDENYDHIQDWQQRCQAVVRTALNYKPEPHSMETQQKLQHNHARFFNKNLVTQRIVTEILEPLRHYAET